VPFVQILARVFFYTKAFMIVLPDADDYHRLRVESMLSLFGDAKRDSCIVPDYNAEPGRIPVTHQLSMSAQADADFILLMEYHLFNLRLELRRIQATGTLSEHKALESAIGELRRLLKAYIH